MSYVSLHAAESHGLEPSTTGHAGTTASSSEGPRRARGTQGAVGERKQMLANAKGIYFNLNFAKPILYQKCEDRVDGLNLRGNHSPPAQFIVKRSQYRMNYSQ